MKNRGPRLREFFEAFMKDLVTEVEKGHKATQHDLLQFQATISANLASGPGERHTILMRRMLLFDTAFSDVLGPDAVAESGMAAQISSLRDQIRGLIYIINKDYANQHGADLFKATNDTAWALETIGEQVADVSEYGRLIDSLYFLLFEGSGDGQRLGDSVPACIDDIRGLRTELRHDIDHGKPGKVRTKRKKAGKTFAKYGDVSSAYALDPEKFPMVQTRVLREIVEMLERIRPTG